MQSNFSGDKMNLTGLLPGLQNGGGDSLLFANEINIEGLILGGVIVLGAGVI